MGEKIIAVVGARLNSSRLPGKHLLPLAGVPLIEQLWKRLERVQALSEIVLATTSDEFNAPLRNWAKEADKKCFEYSGDINNVVGRVDAVVRQYDADVVVYICGDCPLVEPATIDRMLTALLEKQEVENVLLLDGDNGHKPIHEGFDVYRRSFWDRIVASAKEPFEREHVTAVYHHLGKVAPSSTAYVKEPDVFSSVSHRISVDTPSDYRFMNAIYTDWYRENPSQTIVDLANVIERVTKEPALKNINRHVYQKQLRDQSIKALIITEAGPMVGMGHLMRMLAVTGALQDYLGANVTLVIRGEEIEVPELKLVPHHWITNVDSDLIKKELMQNVLHIIDLKEASSFLNMYHTRSPSSGLLIGVDINEADFSKVDIAWTPSFYACEKVENCDNVKYGWDCFLLRDAPIWKELKAGCRKKILVLTGGSDTEGLGNFLPSTLLNELPENTLIDWVQGPYASSPVLPEIDGSKRFKVIKSPDNVPHLLPNYDAVLCVYGVSFFECLRAAVPTIVFDAVGAATGPEWAQLHDTFPAMVAASAEEAVEKIGLLLASDRSVDQLSEISVLLRKGPQLFAKIIAEQLLEKPSVVRKVG